jgi:predicted deacylase
MIQDDQFQLIRGSVIFVPVMNLLAFDRHSRYLPDRRDLNRCFPGAKGGSLAARLAHQIFHEIVLRSDYGIDLHTASVRKTNYPNVRGDLGNPAVARIARAFGSEIVVSGKGPAGAFRREACRAGCPTIIMEGGEVWKVEPTIVESAVRGVKNVLRELEMLAGEPEFPENQIVIEKTRWIRAERGGFLQFHVMPGQVVEADQPLATNTNLLGRERSSLHAPFDGVIIGMTTLPAVSPGEPVCNVGMLPKGTKPSKFRRLRSEDEGLEERLVENLASNVLIVRPPGE